MRDHERRYAEDAVAYALYRDCVARGSKVFFQLSNNFQLDRTWSYWCSPDADLIEVRVDGQVVGYELKGARKHKSGQADFPAAYSGIGQAVAYLDLPIISNKSGGRCMEGGVFDRVYLVCARPNTVVDDDEKRILSLVPIGFLLALPDGRFEEVKDAPRNPIQNAEAKKHFLQNLDSLEKHGTSGRGFRRIRQRGEEYFNGVGSSS